MPFAQSSSALAPAGPFWLCARRTYYLCRCRGAPFRWAASSAAACPPSGVALAPVRTLPAGPGRSAAVPEGERRPGRRPLPLILPDPPGGRGPSFGHRQRRGGGRRGRSAGVAEEERPSRLGALLSTPSAPRCSPLRPPGRSPQGGPLDTAGALEARPARAPMAHHQMRSAQCVILRGCMHGGQRAGRPRARSSDARPVTAPSPGRHGRGKPTPPCAPQTTTATTTPTAMMTDKDECHDHGHENDI